jgi:predicted nucleic acid-binding Zn ribbon protein
MLGSPRPVCRVCGRPRSPRKRETCSDACRTALNRQRKADAERRQKADVGALLEAALNRLRETP